MITSEESLLLIRDPDSDTWMLGKNGEVVQPGSELICPPLYRDRLSIHGQVELTMIGPARAVLRPSADKAAELVLVYGRFLVAGVGDEQRQISVRFENTDSVLTLPAAGNVAAIEVRSLRPPGMDPEDESATQRFVQVWAAEGMPRWRSGNRPEVTLETGQLLTLGSGNQVSLTDARATPPWVAEPVEAVASIESSARKGLLDLVRSNEASELSLREAMDFRRAEVGALAAQTLLLLGATTSISALKAYSIKSASGPTGPITSTPCSKRSIAVLRRRLRCERRLNRWMPPRPKRSIAYFGCDRTANWRPEVTQRSCRHWTVRT